MLAPPDRSLHNLQRELIALRIEHAELNAQVDHLAQPAQAVAPLDDLQIRRDKKRRLMLRDRIALIEGLLHPPESA